MEHHWFLRTISVSLIKIALKLHLYIFLHQQWIK